MIENPIYKGDYIHGKRTGKPTYYENVVEPLISKEMWECCQVQKKKNSRSYMRSQTYLFMQKLKCPKCNKIMGGRATTKKNGIVYYYYGCSHCKNNIKEDYIEEVNKTNQNVRDIANFTISLDKVKEDLEDNQERIEELETIKYEQKLKIESL
jgi:transcription elongation factor Elf1